MRPLNKIEKTIETILATSALVFIGWIIIDKF